MTAAPIIQLRDVRKSYGDVEVLKGFDLEIRQGEFFSLLGPSGCGKTTLLRTIAGFEQLSGGTLMLDGADMARVPPNKRPTNMVFQSYAVFPHLSVAENVAFGLRRDKTLNAQAKKTLVEDALDMVGLDGFGARAAHALSGGQRQRVALARALILRPKVLLLDEPLSALDKKLRENMQVELMKLQRHVGITFILVTHDQEEALVMSDRIAVMFDGRIAQLADSETLYRRPATKRVADFIGTMNFMACEVSSVTGEGAEVEVPGLGRCAVGADQCPGGVKAGSATVGMRPETMTLVFDGDPVRGQLAGGVVDEVVYYGDMTYYDIRLDGMDAPVRLSMRNVIGRDVLDVGVRARVAWDPRALVVFSE